MIARLAQIEPRLLIIALAGVLALGVAGAYSGLFKEAIRELNELRTLKSASSEALDRESSGLGMDAVEREREEVDSLESRLFGTAPRREGTDTVSHIIRRLDGLTRGHRVSLVSVKPGDRGEVLSFVEIPFDVEVEGDYNALIGWLLRAEEELRPMVVKHFHIKQPSDDAALLMSLRVVSYRAPRSER